MKHLVPEYTFDPEKERGLDIHLEKSKEYLANYKEEVIDHLTLDGCLEAISELQIDPDTHAALGLSVLRALLERVDYHVNRNR